MCTWAHFVFGNSAALNWYLLFPPPHEGVTNDDTEALHTPIHTHNSTSLARRSCPLTRKNDHDPKPNVEQAQRVRHQPSHGAHPTHRAKHSTAAIRAPHNRGATRHIPARAIHRRHDADQARKHQRKQTVTQHGGAPRKSEGAGEGRLMVMMVMVGRHVMVGGGGRGGGGVGRWRHEAEDCVKG